MWPKTIYTVPLNVFVFQQSLVKCESNLHVSSHSEDSAFSPNVESLANARGSFLTLTPVYSFFFLSNLEIFPALTVPFFPTLTAVNLQMLAMVMGVVYVTVGSRWGFGLGVAIWLPFEGSWVRILGVNVCTKKYSNDRTKNCVRQPIFLLQFSCGKK